MTNVKTGSGPYDEAHLSVGRAEAFEAAVRWPAQPLKRRLEVGKPVKHRVYNVSFFCSCVTAADGLTDLALRYQSHLASDGSQATTPVPSSGSPRWVATTLPLAFIDCQTDLLGRPRTSPPNQVIGFLYDGSGSGGALPLTGEPAEGELLIASRGSKT